MITESIAQNPNVHDEMTEVYPMISFPSAGVWTQDGLSSGNSGDSHGKVVAERFPKGWNDCSLFTIIGGAVLPCILTFGGLIGNSLTMLVFWKDRRKSAMYVLLLQLAVVDSLVLVIWSFAMVFWIMEFFTDNPPAVSKIVAPYQAKFIWATGALVQVIDIWLIVFITLQRYVAVCHPHKMQKIGSVRAAWIQFALLVIFVTLYTIPRYMYVDIITLENGEVVVKDTELVSDPTYQLWYSLTSYAISFFVPMIMMIFFTVSLIRQLRMSKIKLTVKVNPAQPSVNKASAAPSSTNAHTASEKSKNQPAMIHASKKENSITKSLVVVDIVFLVCQCIYPSRRLFEYLLTAEQKVCPQPYSYYEAMTATGIFINSSVNFIIFCLCSNGFRKQVIQRLCGKNGRVQPAVSVTSGTQ